MTKFQELQKLYELAGAHRANNRNFEALRTEFQIRDLLNEQERQAFDNGREVGERTAEYGRLEY